MAGTGRSTSELMGIVTAFGQAYGKEKLQAEEMNQLIERGIPAWSTLAEVMGKSVAEVQELSEKAKIGRREIGAFIQLLGKRFAGSAEKMADTWEGITARITDSFFEFSQAIADAAFSKRSRTGCVLS